MLSSQEEIGCLGAKTGAYAINPNEAIAVDVSFGNQPGVDEYSSGKLGNGTMIGVSPILNKEMSKKLFEIAKENHILFQTEVMGGKTGTTADVISTTRCGVPTALLSIPLRNMHTGAEVIDMTDIEATVQLICSYVKQRSDML